MQRGRVIGKVDQPKGAGDLAARGTRLETGLRYLKFTGASRTGLDRLT